MRASVLKFLEADVEFLKANNIMDYSLMVGVHNVPAGICCLDSDLGGHRENGNPKYGIRSCCNDAANGAVRDGVMSPTGRYQPSHPPVYNAKHVAYVHFHVKPAVADAGCT